MTSVFDKRSLIGSELHHLLPPISSYAVGAVRRLPAAVVNSRRRRLDDYGRLRGYPEERRPRGMDPTGHELRGLRRQFEQSRTSWPRSQFHSPRDVSPTGGGCPFVRCTACSTSRYSPTLASPRGSGARRDPTTNPTFGTGRSSTDSGTRREGRRR